MEKTTKILIIGLLASLTMWGGAYSYSNREQKLAGVTTVGVQGGGTGANSFQAYPIVGNGGTNPLTASSSIWVLGVNATSTTASSTFNGLQAKNLSLTGTSATSTFANGVQLSGGCFMDITGTCLTSASGIATLNGLSGGTQSFATPNGLLVISSAGTTHTFNASTSPYYGNLTATGTIAFAGLSSGLLGSNSGYLYSFASSSLFGFTPLSSHDEFTHPATGQSATTSQMNMAGLLSTASSTVSSNLMVSGLLQASSTLSAQNLTVLGTLNIPTNANPTIDVLGKLALNSTAASSSIRVNDGTAERSLYFSRGKTLVLASSTLSYIGAYGSAGTTTILVANYERPVTLTRLYCKTDVGVANVEFTDGSNKTDLLQCGTGGTEDDGSIANNTWVAREDLKVSIGDSVSSPNVITITPSIREDSD